MLGRFSIDLLEKLHPFLMPVLTLDETDQASLKVILGDDISETGRSVGKSDALIFLTVFSYNAI